MIGIFDQLETEHASAILDGLVVIGNEQAQGKRFYSRASY
jgi:hypothetical protein